MLAAVVLCLTACGESKDMDAESPRSEGEPTVASTQYDAPTAEADDPNNDGADLPAGDNADDSSAPQPDGDGTTKQNDAVQPVTPGDDTTDPDNRPDGYDAPQDAEPTAAPPAATESIPSEDTDNAVVNINDL